MTEQVKRTISGANDPLPKELAQINLDLDYMIRLVDKDMGGYLPTATAMIDDVVALNALVQTRNLVLDAVYSKKGPHINDDIDHFVTRYMTSGEGVGNDISRLFGLRDKAEKIIARSNEDKGQLQGVFARTDQNYIRLNQAAYSMLETAQRHSQGLRPREFTRGLDRILDGLNQE